MSDSHYLVNTMTNKCQYEPDRVLRVYDLLVETIRQGWWGDSSGYGHATTDEDKIIELYELTRESILGDFLFSGGDVNQGSELLTEDEAA